MLNNKVCGLKHAQLAIPASFGECFTYEKQILWLKKEIENIHPDVFESVFGLILRSAVYTLEGILVSVITFGFGSIVLVIKECITRLSGILETYKKNGFDIEMVDMYKMNLIGCTTVLIKHADEIIIKAKNEKS